MIDFTDEELDDLFPINNENILNQNKMKTLKELSHNVFYDMRNYSQLIIDLVSQAEEIFNDSDSKMDDFGALSYDVENVLEIIDKTRKHDVEALELLSFLLNEKLYLTPKLKQDESK
jgi:hypothetical protein